jgi:ATP-dependent Clp endopeptidase proteolytic subunit ClpP
MGVEVDGHDPLEKFESDEGQELSWEDAWHIESITALTAEAEKHRQEARLYEVQAWDAERQLKAFKTRTLYFADEVEEMEVKAAVDRLLDWQIEGDDPITVVLNSPGGDVFMGLMLFDTLAAIRQSGIHVTTVVRGYAASMASILSQAGDTRVISPNSWYMIHEPSNIVIGTASRVKTEARLLEALHKQMCGVLSERSTLTTEEIQRHCDGKDWWMPAQEALALGFFDQIA